MQRGERTAAERLGGSSAKPVAALLRADSPARSHLFPFHSSPTCLPPARLPGRRLLPSSSLHSRLLVALKEGDHCLWGCENLRHPRAWNHQNGLAEGPCRYHRVLPQPTRRPCPALALLPQSHPGSGGRQGEKEGVV